MGFSLYFSIWICESIGTFSVTILDAGGRRCCRVRPERLGLTVRCPPAWLLPLKQGSSRFRPCAPLEPSSRMNKLIFANLLHRPVRSIISVLAVAIEVIMILSIVGIFMGMLNDQKQRTNGIGADLMVRPSNASISTGWAARPCRSRMSRLSAACRTSPWFRRSSPTLTPTARRNPLRHRLPELQRAQALRLSRRRAVPGARRRDRRRRVCAAPTAGHHVGDTIKIMNQPFRISGIVEHGKGGRKLMPIDTMGEIIGRQGQGFGLLHQVRQSGQRERRHPGDPRHARPGKLRCMTMEEWSRMMTPDKIPGFNIALDVVTGIAVIVGFLVIFQSMYTAVLERTREIGILKSMGASKPAIVSVVLRETRGAGGRRRAGGHCGHLRREVYCCATCFPPSTLRSRGTGSSRERPLPLPARCAARSTRPGWPRARIPSTRWPTSSA